MARPPLLCEEGNILPHFPAFPIRFTPSVTADRRYSSFIVYRVHDVCILSAA